jgi:hypothetical protein
MMIVTLDSMSTRYHLLPSEVMDRATTFDLWIMDAATAFHEYQRKKAENGGRDPAPKLNQEQMLDMIQRVKEKNHAQG